MCWQLPMQLCDCHTRCATQPHPSAWLRHSSLVSILLVTTNLWMWHNPRHPNTHERFADSMAITKRNRGLAVHASLQPNPYSIKWPNWAFGKLKRTGEGGRLRAPFPAPQCLHRCVHHNPLVSSETTQMPWTSLDGCCSFPKPSGWMLLFHGRATPFTAHSTSCTLRSHVFRYVSCKRMTDAAGDIQCLAILDTWRCIVS